MTYAYAAKAGTLADDGVPPGWPDGWDWPGPPWPPGWPWDSGYDSGDFEIVITPIETDITIGVPHWFEIELQATGDGDPADFDGHYFAVETHLGIASLALNDSYPESWSGFDYTLFSAEITNYSGAKYGWEGELWFELSNGKVGRDFSLTAFINGVSHPYTKRYEAVILGLLDVQVTVPDEIEIETANTVTVDFKAEDGVTDADNTDGLTFTVTAEKDGSPLQLKESGDPTFVDSLVFAISNYTAALYGATMDLLFDIDAGDVDDTITVTVTLDETNPATISGNDSGTVVTSAAEWQDVTDDTFADSSAPTTPRENFGHTKCYQYGAGPGNRKYTYIKAPIAGAGTLAIYIGKWAWNWPEETVAVYYAAGAWDPATLTWNNQPGAGALITTFEVPSTVRSWKQIELPESTHGYVLMIDDPGVGNGYTWAEDSSDPTLKPQWYG